MKGFAERRKSSFDKGMACRGEGKRTGGFVVDLEGMLESYPETHDS